LNSLQSASEGKISITSQIQQGLTEALKLTEIDNGRAAIKQNKTKQNRPAMHHLFIFTRKNKINMKLKKQNN